MLTASLWNRHLAASLRSVSFGGPSRSYAAEITENADGTFDMLGVEILSTGGPINGVGSPPAGDYWTLDQLQGMATAAAELGPEMVAPNKIGHADEQVLIQNSIKAGEIPAPTDGELPAAGWVTNQRVEGQKLLGDIKRVPRIVKDVISVGAYRKRSAELSKVKSQVSGKEYPWVVSGLAWLGGKQPAVKTLGDVVALYEGAADVEVRYVTDDAIGATGPEEIRAMLREELDRGVTLRNGHSDTGAMRYSAEQVRKFADATGLKSDEVTEKMLEDAGVAPPAAEPTAEEKAAAEKAAADKAVADKAAADQAAADAAAAAGEPEADRELTQRLVKLEERNRALELENHHERRRTFVDATIKAGKFAPGQRSMLETLFDKDPDLARSFADEQKPRADLLNEFGSDEDDGDERKLEERDRAYAEDASSRLGIPKDKIV